MSAAPERPCCSRALWLIAAGWFLVALFVGEMELFLVLPGPAPQIAIVALTSFLLLNYGRSRPFKKWVDSLRAEILIGLHLSRFVGVYFLVLGSRGELPPGFALPAGGGDIAVALGAAGLIFFRAPRWAVLAWNTIGLIDILFVVGRAAVLRAADPEALMALTTLPLSFLPTLLVPLIIATHVVLFARFLRPVPAEQSRTVQPALPALR